MTDQAWRHVNALEQVMLDDYAPLPPKPVVITVIFSLSRNVPPSFLQSVIVPRLLTHPRFSSILTFHRNRHNFTPLPSFSATSPQIQSHLHLHPPTSPPSDFSSELSSLISAPLPINLPLWAVHLFPQVSLSQTSSADVSTLVLRVHHSLVDGVGLVKYFLAHLVDQPPDRPITLLTPSRRSADKKVEHYSGIKALISGFGDFGSVFLKPMFKDRVSELTRDANGPQNNCAVMKSTMGVDDLKIHAKRLGVSINDILYAAYAGAVRRYVMEIGDEEECLKGMTVAMPFNRHAYDSFHERDVSNRVVMMALPLMADAKSTKERLELCAKKMKRVRSGFQPRFAVLAMKQLEWVPQWLRKKLWHMMASSVSSLFSNVAGPTRRMTVGDTEVEAVHFFPPPNAQVAVTFGVFSYAGDFFMGIAGSEERLKKPQSLLDFLMGELVEITKLESDDQADQN